MVSRLEKYLTALSILIGIALISLTLGKSIIAGVQPSLASFIIIHFAGYLFFLLMPVEGLVPYYLSLGYNPLILLILALLTAIVAQLLDYSFGYLVSNDVINNFFGKKKYKKMRVYIREYGGVAILLFNLFPLSSPVLALVAGMVRMRFRRLLLYSFLGLVVKYSVIVYLFLYLV